MKKFICILLALSTLSAYAEDSEPATEESPVEEVSPSPKACEFNIECKTHQADFNFEYKVLGDGCADNSAGDLIFVSEDKRFPLQFKGLPLKKFEDFGNADKVCEVDGRKYPAAEISENRLALFVRIDNRPALDRLGALIVDLRRKKVIKVESNLGEIKSQSFAMLKSGRGYKTRLAKDRIKGVACECDAAMTDAWKEIIPYDDIFKTKWIK